MTLFLTVYLFLGAAAALFARWAWRLYFDEPSRLTLGFLLLALVPPLAFLTGIVSVASWLFDDPESNRHARVQWPPWALRQRRLWRWVWFLGNPPPQVSP